MYQEHELYGIWFCLNAPFSAKKRLSISRLLGGPENVFRADDQTLLRAGCLEEEVKALERTKDIDKLALTLAEWEREGIRVITSYMEAFPEKLLRAFPPVDHLFVSGKTELLKTPCLAVVGARKCSGYGAGVARYLGRKFARAGYTVVSGLAMGVDACSHRGCLEAGGNTIAVMGNGIDYCYPRSNYVLYEQIRRKGLIISEYPPGTQPVRGFFPMRNRIIAHLSEAVVVAEAGEKSGALITADIASEAGIDVFAVPGPVFEKTSIGANRLIQQGAGIVTTWEDVCLHCAPGTVGISENGSGGGEPRFREERLKKLWSALEWTPKAIDDLSGQTQLSPQEVLCGITQLELAGCAEKTPDGKIVRII